MAQAKVDFNEIYQVVFNFATYLLVIVFIAKAIKTYFMMREGDSLDNVTTMGLYDTAKVVENVSFLRLFSECQGTFEGYFADVIYYRDQDGLIFPRDYTYSQYQSLKASQGDGGVMNNTGENRRR